MVASKMHANEIDINVYFVQKLLEAQFPQWSELPIDLASSTGTDHVIYRLGKEMAIRLPRIASAALQIDKEYQWLPRLAPYLPLAIPVPLCKGMPTEGYPWPWYIYQWLAGQNATVEQISDLHQAAIDLGHFVAALQQINPTDGPLSERGHPLAACDYDTLLALNSLHGIIDVNAATEAWKAALHAPEWNRPPVWVHGDLHPGNLLVDRSRLSAVIDFGLTGVGDPACDMIVAWTVLSAKTRDTFRAVVQADDATWARGRGWALTFGLVALPYYQHTNPVLARIAQHTIDEVLSEYTTYKISN
jgi:aminoglycoside phosphotransferase (APT) family kinase protein